MYRLYRCLVDIDRSSLKSLLPPLPQDMQQLIEAITAKSRFVAVEIIDSALMAAIAPVNNYSRSLALLLENIGLEIRRCLEDSLVGLVQLFKGVDLLAIQRDNWSQKALSLARLNSALSDNDADFVAASVLAAGPRCPPTADAMMLLLTTKVSPNPSPACRAVIAEPSNLSPSITYAAGLL